jgi:hypothetical protein
MGHRHGYAAFIPSGFSGHSHVQLFPAKLSHVGYEIGPVKIAKDAFAPEE